ncbi:hypothetical protein [Streptomyces misionensis]|uniref:hypothetical protein n=1 Tax=Streptomyces misionensis TaxID=67331 RepID=UPI003BB0BABC
MGDSGTYTYAWCLDHGRLHRFAQQEGAWCSALWVALAGDDEQSALADKQARFGDARFFDQLPQQVQVELVESRA